MRDKPTYIMMSAVHPQCGDQRFVIVDRDGRMHSAGTASLQYLSDSGKSPHTAREYGRRVAWYLSWCAQTMDWRGATLSHIALWRQTVAATPVVKSNGKPGTRSASTVKLWIVAVRSFYEWADAHELLSTDLLSRMTQLKSDTP
jgi:site-specific recombinase XerD